MLVAQEYAQQSKKQRGAIRGYLSKVTGLGLPQITRLIRGCRQTGKVQAKPCRRRRFRASTASRAQAGLKRGPSRINFSDPNRVYNVTTLSTFGRFTGTRGSFSDVGSRTHSVLVGRLEW